MSKKLLSLLLVLCMIVVAVPVFTIVTLADELPQPFKTSFIDNYPTFPEGKTWAKDAIHYLWGDKYGIQMQFNGNWDVVTHEKANQHNIRQATWLMNGAVDAYSDTFLATGINDSYGAFSSMRWQASGYWGSTGSFKVLASTPIGFRYLSPYAGTATITFENGLTSARTDGDVYYAVFQNGTMIWPNAGDYYSDFTKWYCIPKATTGKQTPDVSALKDITVNVGDSIEILAGASADTWTVECLPTINFTAITAQGKVRNVTNSVFSQADASKMNYYAIKAGEKADGNTYWHGNWAIGAQTTANPADWVRYDVWDTAWDGWPEYSANMWSDGFVYTGGGDMVTPASDARKTGFRYTAPETGRLTFNVSKMVVKSAGAHYAAIFQNNKMVWPKANGSYTDKADWYNLETTGDAAAAMNAKLNLLVCEGDTVTLLLWHAGVTGGETSRSVNNTYIDCYYTEYLDLLKPTYDYNENGRTLSFTYTPGIVTDVVVKATAKSVVDEQAAETTLTPVGGVYTITPATDYATDVTVTFTGKAGTNDFKIEKTFNFIGKDKDGYAYTTAFNATTNVPTLAGEAGSRSATFYDNWDVINYKSKDAMNAAPAVMKFDGARNGARLLTPTQFSTIGAADGIYTKVSATAVSLDTNGDWCGNVLSIYAINGNVVGYRYTMPQDGTVDIAIEQIGRKGNWKNNGEFAVFAAGQKIWPAGDDWYAFVTESTNYALNADQIAEINAALKKAEGYSLKAGDTIEFLYCGNGTSNWSDTGNVIYPKVSYKTDYTADRHATATYNAVKVVDRQTAEVYVSDFLAIGKDKFPTFEIPEGSTFTNAAGETVDPTGIIPAAGNYYVSNPLVTDTFAKHIPVINGSKVEMQGFWSAVHGNWSGDIATADKPTWAYQCDLNKLDGSILISTVAGLWAENGGGMYTNGANAGKFAVCKTSSKVGNGAMYTAPADGYVQFDYTKLVARRETNDSTAAGAVSTYLAVTLNGQVVWPSNGNPWKYTGDVVYPLAVSHEDDILAAAKEYEAFPTLKVKAGDEIAFIGNMGNATTWMFYILPSVTYAKVGELDAANVNVSGTLGTELKLNLTADVDDIMTDVAVKFDNEAAAAVEGKFTTKGYLPNEITTEVAYEVTAKIGNTAFTVAQGTTSVAAYLKALAADDKQDAAARDLAVATLNYATEVQKYFAEEELAEEDLINYGVADTTNYQAKNLNTLASSRNIGKKAEAINAAIIGMNVSLGEDIEMVVAYKTATKGDYVLHYMIGDAAQEPIALTNGDGEASVKVAPAGIAEVYTFWITLGDAVVSNTVTYSVSDYAKQMRAEADLVNLLKAIVVYGEKAAAYLA